MAAAHDTLVGIKFMPLLQKRQVVIEEDAEALTGAEPCSALAACSPTDRVNSPSV